VPGCYITIAACPCKWRDAIVASYGGTKRNRPEEYKRRSPELAAEQLTMPLALTVGGLDTLVPTHSVRRLAARLREAGRKDILLVDDPQGGHSTDYNTTVSAFEFVLRAAEAERE
jgi:dienelactone hydrolase